MPRLGYLGGTFDPIHNGHVVVAEQLFEAAALDTVFLVPAASPAHRPEPVAGPEDRLQMTRLAIAGHSRLVALDLEVRRGGTSYTVDTMRALAESDPGAERVLLLGWDAAELFSTWRQPAAIAELCRIAIFNRSGVPLPAADRLLQMGFPVGTALLHVESPPISATQVRERLAAGLDVSSMLPPEVAAHIQKRHLYGA